MRTQIAERTAGQPQCPLWELPSGSPDPWHRDTGQAPGGQAPEVSVHDAQAVQVGDSA